MWIAENIATLFSLKQIISVLDLGAGNGKRSLFSASYGAKVIAIDNQSMPLWQFPKPRHNLVLSQQFRPGHR